ncbi:MAG: hypothetical protein R3325_14050 [Thermoanaerobaculia bacterium]|nr:hypothetical protein [Thermoanaerobaculia bacterium]
MEILSLREALGRRPVGRLARWVFRAQGNVSLVAVALSVALALRAPGLAPLLAGIWLLLLGHSLFALGGLAYRPLRTTGLLYQAGGLAALWPAFDPLVVFAIATAAGNLYMGASLWRRRG